MHTWQLGRHDDLRRMDMYIDTEYGNSCKITTQHGEKTTIS